jgi:hypothetical protein
MSPRQLALVLAVANSRFFECEDASGEGKLTVLRKIDYRL